MVAQHLAKCGRVWVSMVEFGQNWAGCVHIVFTLAGGSEVLGADLAASKVSGRGHGKVAIRGCAAAGP